MLMNWFEAPAEPAHARPATTVAPSQTAPSRLRRGVVTAAIAALLLVGGGVAAVSAASPDPSASPSPSATTDPSGGTDGNGGTAAPSALPTSPCRGDVGRIHQCQELVEDVIELVGTIHLEEVARARHDPVGQVRIELVELVGCLG